MSVQKQKQKQEPLPQKEVSQKETVQEPRKTETIEGIDLGEDIDETLLKEGAEIAKNYRQKGGQ